MFQKKLIARSTESSLEKAKKQITNHPAYYPTIDRVKAENLLKGKKVGTYLLWKRKREGNDYVISYVADSKIEHALFTINQYGFFNHSGNSLVKLEYYILNTEQLKYPLTKEKRR